jgi:hypothetical protein
MATLKRTDTQFEVGAIKHRISLTTDNDGLVIKKTYEYRKVLGKNCYIGKLIKSEVSNNIAFLFYEEKSKSLALEQVEKALNMCLKDWENPQKLNEIINFFGAG